VANFQLIGCEVCLGGDKDNTVVRDQFDPVTYPEYLILKALHDGEDGVRDAVAVGYVERDPNAERERLSLKYGAALVAGLFPGALAMLPAEDVSLPTLEEVEAGAKADREARKTVRSKTKGKPASAPVGNGAALPDLTA
jgi:hypothetical protein